MKKILLFTTSLFCLCFLNAQEITKNTLNSEFNKIQFSFAFDNNVVIVQDYKNKESEGHIISILDQSFNTIKDLKIKDSKSLIRNASIDGNNLYLLLQKNKKQESVIDFEVMTIDLNDFTRTTKLLHSLNENNHSTIGRFFYQNSSYAEMGRIDVSQDRNYISLSIESRINKLRTKSITVLFFNSKYELLYKKQYTHNWNKNADSFQYKSSFINSKNKSLTVLNIINSSTYKIEQVNQDNYTVKDFSFKNTNLKTLVINGINDNFYCTGFFFSDSKKGKDGIFYSKFSNNLELLEEKNINYSSQLLEQDQSKKQKNKGFTKINSKVGASFVATDLLIDNESDFYLIGEIRISLNNSNAYDDVAVVKLNKNGELKWSRLVDKSQHLYFDVQSSFKPLIIANKLHLLFNSTLSSDELNMDKNSAKPYELRRLNLYSVNFDEEGQFAYKQLTDKNTDVNYFVRESNLIDTHSLILFGHHKKESHIMKIDFNN